MTPYFESRNLTKQIMCFIAFVMSQNKRGGLKCVLDLNEKWLPKLISSSFRKTIVVRVV